MTTKRRRLVADTPSPEAKSEDEQARVKEHPKIKTRKVKVDVEKQEPAKKKRKSVKRKSKGKNSKEASGKKLQSRPVEDEEHVIDEKTLQNNLINEFTGNE